MTWQPCLWLVSLKRWRDKRNVGKGQKIENDWYKHKFLLYSKLFCYSPVEARYFPKGISALTSWFCCCFCFPFLFFELWIGPWLLLTVTTISSGLVGWERRTEKSNHINLVLTFFIMVVRLRLSRQGTKNNPFYHLVAIADHKPRDARPIEKLGEYDPIPRRIPILPKPNPTSNSNSTPTTNSKGKAIEKNGGQLITSGLPTGFRLEKRLEWDQSRIKHWLEKGAQPSRPVAKLLDRVSSWIAKCIGSRRLRPERMAREGEEHLLSGKQEWQKAEQNKRLFALQAKLLPSIWLSRKIYLCFEWATEHFS